VIERAFGLPGEVALGRKVPLGEGVASWVARMKKPLLVKDFGREVRFVAPKPGYETASFISVPLFLRERVVGVVNVADRADGRPFDESDLEALLAMVDHMAICVENQKLRDDVARLAATDPLTGVWNRRHFERRLEEELARAQRSEASLSLLMIDVDDFKAFNDTHGHTAGDAVLRGVSRSINSAVRTGDIVCRYGGDEFAVILPRTDVVEALSVAGRICQRVAATPHTLEGEGTKHFSISVGVSSYPVIATSRQELVDQADRAMYEAKYSEVSQICLAEATTTMPEAPLPNYEKVPYLPLPPEVPSRELASLFPLEVARRLECVPVGREGRDLTLALADPSQAFAIRVVSQLTGLRVFPVVSGREEIQQALRRMATLSQG
jgi:diguanylate cyclase (GGDEF)-like protein